LWDVKGSSWSHIKLLDHIKSFVSHNSYSSILICQSWHSGIT